MIMNLRRTMRDARNFFLSVGISKRRDVGHFKRQPDELARRER